MKQEVVQNFLDLPGIVGVALMDGRSRPFFCGIDQFLNFQQKEALAQGIRQVIETTPDSFTDFQFKFTDTQIYIYKLHRGLILLVLANQDLLLADYVPVMALLKSTIQEDLSNAIATFRLLVGNATLTGQNYWNTKSGVSTNVPKSNVSNTKTVAPKVIDPSAVVRPGTPTQTRDTVTNSPEIGTVTNPAAAVPSVSVKDYLQALNQLSQFSKQYLGTAVIVNYWKSSRPKDDWLMAFEIERSGTLQLASGSASLARNGVNARQKQLMREWVAAFVKRCSMVIRDFSDLLKKGDLDDKTKGLLF
ncbi:hypothetical protein [Prochlorothrix hollandica]|uniref:Uncharacterized protein n=1 Tax=Prochlorothrix hollandica PCC 9006 = CALU 1027 TaxID=317619 RepID=A0A0M2PXY6_PROHO|nr:hypothetical protein [Prochlorothrix hollandica]KKI99942.1 hypothetical protein PROH_09105 [Prochlorothrix hollandica PCC 9006 = CALU 1027]